MTTTCQRVDAKGKPCGGEIEDGVCGTCGRPEQRGALVSNVAAARSGTGTQARGTTAVTGTVGTARTGSGRVSRRHGNASATSRRQSLGGGLVSLPPVPSQDPERLVMVDPEVPPNKRACPHCQAKVNRVNGFCSQCGKPYDFRPKLHRGDVVAGKYEIRGPIGLGGMGWIYLATDVTLKRWVVLKGVLNAQDPDAAAAAVAERQFLAAVKDPKIVQIYDFVSQGSEGYMVLEYVGGRTVDQIRADNDVVDLLAPDGTVVRSGVMRKDIAPSDAGLVANVTKFGVLPPEQAVSYMLAVCSAFSYLHAQGFTHNDMKPDNVMVEGDAVKLLDLGAMRRIGDESGLVFGTEGYFAPEASEDPIAVSDLYSVGRSLAILLMDFLYKARADTDAATGRVTTRRLIVKGFKNAIPTPAEQPVLARFDSLYRFLLRATAEDPDQRFQSADEMEGQLFGILREIVASTTGPRPAESKVFFGDGLVDGADHLGTLAPLARNLPTLRIDPADAGAADLVRLAALTDPAKRAQALVELVARRPKSTEAKLRLADAYVAKVQGGWDGGDLEGSVLPVTDGILKDDEFEWRAHWYAGKALLQDGKAAEARDRFDRTYFEMPGDLAPKLAVAFAAEASGDVAAAARFYSIVVATDPSHASACFGLARCALAVGDHAKAAEALAAVPPSSSMFAESRLALAQVILAGGGATIDDMRRAGDAVAAVGGGSGRAHRAAGALFARTATLIEEGRIKDAGGKDDVLNGVGLQARSMRLASEAEYLEAGRLAPDLAERARWVDAAHAVRPVTLT